MNRRHVLNAFRIAAFAVAVAALVWLGLFARREAWARTEPLRYDGDMQNGWNWGSRSAREGYFALYDRIVGESKDHQYGLDYLPLRLAAMTLWAKGELANAPDTKEWQRAYAFNRPLLRFNTLCEGLTTLGLFAIALDWLRRDRRAAAVECRRFYGLWLALAVAACAWLNPASLVSAHVRPTWDAWVTPFYVWAVFSATRNGWLTAGCIVGVGAMFKGQVLFAVPLFLLWPMMRFRVGAVARFVIGFAVSVLIVASPWMVGRSLKAIAFVAGLTLVPVVVWAVIYRWPIARRRIPARWLRWSVPAALAVAIGLCVPLFGGSMNWLRVGLIYGAEKFSGLDVGGSDSLAAILQKNYHWSADDRVPMVQGLIPAVLAKRMPPVTISHVMIALFGLCLLPTAWAASRYEKRGDRRFVLTIAAPWLAYFALFPKMHERYLLWGATVACAGLIVNFGMLWLALFFTLCSTGMSLAQMTFSARLSAYVSHHPLDPMVRPIDNVVNPTAPGLGWAVLLALATWMWVMTAGAFDQRRAQLPTSAAEEGLNTKTRRHEEEIE